jgi:tRNA U34 5-methylaminomethyl-2-thiouridine-forming methyltransferase MnmC
MQREIIATGDGSSTIRIAAWDECYHSQHGAIQEALHVFIGHGFNAFDVQSLSILEIGFGTGLNAFLTLQAAIATNKTIKYTGVEAFPVPLEELKLLNYTQNHDLDLAEKFDALHSSEWEAPVAISPGFTLTKRLQRFEEVVFTNEFDIIYFDAFGYRVQPELWTEAIFIKMFNALRPGGRLVTYAARSVISSNLRKAGFMVTKVQGPPGKREMTIALKP